MTPVGAKQMVAISVHGPECAGKKGGAWFSFQAGVRLFLRVDPTSQLGAVEIVGSFKADLDRV